MKSAFLIFFALFFISCQTQPKPTPPPKVQAPQTPPKIIEKPKPKKVISNMLRGVILSQTKQNNSYIYQLKIKDIATQAKLKSFLYDKKSYDIGDLVYVIFDENDTIKNILLIQKAYELPKKEKKPKVSNQKRTKKHQLVKLPLEQTIKIK